MRIVEIASRDDPRVAVYRGLRDATLRDASGLFIVEGRLGVRRLLEASRFRTCSLFVTRTALAALSDVLPKLDPDTPIYLASQAELNSVVGYNIHRGCLAAVERGVPTSSDAILCRRSGGPRRLLVLEDVANPDNVGGAFRNAWAFGASGVLLSARCADPLYRKAVRVSMGGSLCVPFAWLESGVDLFAQLVAQGFRSVALTTDPGAPELAELPPAQASLALLLGAEGDGLRAESLAASDARARIPMAPGVNSLNLATAAGIALYHFASARTR